MAQRVVSTRDIRGLASVGRDIGGSGSLVRIERESLLDNGFAHRTDADHSVNACRRFEDHVDAYWWDLVIED